MNQVFEEEKNLQTGFKFFIQGNKRTTLILLHKAD